MKMLLLLSIQGGTESECHFLVFLILLSSGDMGDDSDAELVEVF
jgi:hypothetical protein